MSADPTPISTVRALTDCIGYELDALRDPHPNPIVAQYQLAVIRDLASELYIISGKLATQLADEARRIRKEENTNG